MNKKPIFTMFFVVCSIGILLFIISESLRHMEKKAAETYLKSIQSEFSEYSKNVVMDEVECSRTFGRICKIEKIQILDEDSQIELQNITIQTTHISYNKIGVRFDVESISHNLWEEPFAIFFPQQFTYTLELKKEDSALGYIALNRAIAMKFENFNIDMKLDLMLRGELFRNKNILFLAKEWFDSSTPSFYEYSLSNLAVEIGAENIGKFYQNHFARKNISLQGAMNDFKDSFKKNNLTNKLATSYFNGFVESFYELLSGNVDEIEFIVRRKNDDLIFFNTLDSEAAQKKMLEIARILDSINSAHHIELNKTIK